jgi:hypothetical protein
MTDDCVPTCPYVLIAAPVSKPSYAMFPFPPAPPSTLPLASVLKPISTVTMPPP